MVSVFTFTVICLYTYVLLSSSYIFPSFLCISNDGKYSHFLELRNCQLAFSFYPLWPSFSFLLYLFLLLLSFVFQLVRTQLTSSPAWLCRLLRELNNHPQQFRATKMIFSLLQNPIRTVNGWLCADSIQCVCVCIRRTCLLNAKRQPMNKII